MPPKVLNYKYAIFPTKPQRIHLSARMKERRIQWNRAVATRRRLRANLECFKIEYVLRQVMSETKDNTHYKRIQSFENKYAERFPDVESVDERGTLLDLCDAFHKSFTIEAKHVDCKLLAAELAPLLRAELTDFRAYLKTPEEERPDKPPRRDIYYCLMRLVTSYAGLEAYRHMAKAFKANTKAISEVRYQISGGPKADFESACSILSDKQIAAGTKNEPRFKDRVSSYGFQVQKRYKVNQERRVRIKGLPDGMEWVSINFHRPLPDEANVKEITVMETGSQWYGVLTIDIPDKAYQIEAKTPECSIGLDPGAETAITEAVLNPQNDEPTFKKHDWRPLEENLEKLEHLQQRLSRMQGRDRRKRQQPSKRWLRLSKEIRRLHERIRNQRRDNLHTLSRHLADHGFIAIGHWEPPREVAGRADFQEGKTESVEPGPKGIVAARRGGRDRAIATLRDLTEEKAKRSGARCIIHADEYNTTRRCSQCSQLTGPKGDLDIRRWKCSDCDAEHDRDENAALNILQLALSQQSE